MTAREIRETVGVALAAAVVLGVDAGTRVLGNNDEARFPMLAQDILARGDWLHPRLEGAVYANKPVLLAWLIALVSWPAGHVTQLTAALPSAVAACATVLLVYGFASDLLGRDAARFAALVALTTQGLFVHARLPLPDMLMTCFMTAALWTLAKVVRGDRGPWWVAFSVLTGLAFWAKGPAGLLPLGVAIVYRIATRRAERTPRLHPVATFAIVAGFVALWWVVARLGDASAARQAVVVDQLAWYRPQLHPLRMLAEPVRNVFGVLFPWVLVAPIVLVHAWRFCRGRGAERDRVLFLLVWIAVLFVLVALSQQQRMRYCVPFVSPLALLTGWWTAGVVVKHRPVQGVPWRIYGMAAALLIGASAVVLVSKGDWPKDLRLDVPASLTEMAVLAVALIAIVTALALGIRTGRLRHAVPIAALGSAVLLMTGYHGEVERRNARYDFVRLARVVHPMLDDRSVVLAWDVPALPVSFYLGHPVLAVESEAEVRAAMERGDTAIVLVRDKTLAGLDGARGRTLLAREPFGPGGVAVVRWKRQDT